MIIRKKTTLSAMAASAAMACAGTTHAAEGFELRYNLAGSLGGEMFAPPDQSGLAIGIAATEVRVKKITGNDGQTFSHSIPGGTVPLPAPVPSALYPSYGSGVATVDATGTMKQWNLALGYLTSDRFGGGRFAFGINVPYATKTYAVRASAATPALAWSPAIPAQTQAAVASRFDSQYQAAVAAQAAGDSGEVSSIGDVEVLAGWQHVDDKLRVLAGAAIILPTGKYSALPGPDVGTGNFYTFRPEAQIAYLPTSEIGLAAKVSMGFNTRNSDNALRSGNWIGLEAAAGYKSPIGVFGVHGIHMDQYQDDSNNPLGPSRFRTTSAGVFFTTLVPAIDVAMTLQYMGTTASRNAKHGDYAQVRFIKVF